jgi:hypothetical protein
MDDRVRESLEASRESAVAQREELDKVISGLDEMLGDEKDVAKELSSLARNPSTGKKKRGRPAKKDKTFPFASKLSRGALFGAIVEAVKNAEGPISTKDVATIVRSPYASVYGALRSKGKAAGVTLSGKGIWVYKTPVSQAPVKKGTSPKPAQKVTVVDVGSASPAEAQKISEEATARAEASE